VVGSSWKEIYYLKSQPSTKKRTPTADQLDQQHRFSVVLNFIQTIVGLVQLTFKKYAVKMSEYNAAFSYNYHNALTGTSPDYTIDFSKALVSRGDLLNATAPAATLTGNTVFFTWTDNSGLGKAASTDKAIFVVFCPNLNLSLYGGNADRSAGAGSLDVSAFAGETLHAWITFLSEDGADAANSIYTGELS
jgi:hypothetical protein